jgi:methanogenic corrinoid protein MtbC1
VFVLMVSMKQLMEHVSHAQMAVLNVHLLQNVMHALLKPLTMEMEHVNVHQEHSLVLHPME